MKQVRCLSSCLLMLSISIACSYAANIPSKKGMTVKGIVTDTRKSPISGVVVTDGVHFTQTDEKDIIIFHPTSTNPSLCMCRYRQIINPQLRMHFLPDTMPDWINQKRQTDMISN